MKDMDFQVNVLMRDKLMLLAVIQGISLSHGTRVELETLAHKIDEEINRLQRLEEINASCEKFSFIFSNNN